MKRRLLFIGSVLGLLTLPALPIGLAAQRHKPTHARYVITDLGTLGGPGTNSSAFDMNSAGWVAGSGNQFPGGPQHAFLWFGKPPLFDLGTLGGPNSEAGGPNARGEAAIISETTRPDLEDFCGFGNGLQCLAAIWRSGKLRALPTLSGGHNAQAYGLNNVGQVIGFSETRVEDPSCLTPAMPSQIFRYEAVIWEPNGQIRKLRPLASDTVGFAFSINDHGVAVGTSGLCSDTVPPLRPPTGAHAVLWEADGSPHDLGSLGGTSNVATSINNRNQVVGTSASAADGTVHAFVWTRTTGMRDLGTFAGAVATVAPCCNTINAKGQVVGFWFDEMFNARAFIWQDNLLTNLDELIPNESPWHLQFAQAINDAGEIVGQGQIGGESHAFLATPCARNHAVSERCKN